MKEEAKMAWPFIVFTALPDRLSALEERLAGLFETGELLGTQRELWRDPDELPRSPGETPPPGRERLWIYLARHVSPEEAAQRLGSNLGNLDGKDGPSDLDMQTGYQDDTDWSTGWRDYFQPVRVSPHLAVAPAWVEPAQAADRLGLGEGALVLRVDPGQAFGTGTHGTTRLCLEWLEEIVRPGNTVLDFGAGSGILSIAARRLGAVHVVGIEDDPVCVENFQLNAVLNDTPDGIEYVTGSSERLVEMGDFDVVVCNALFHRVRDHFGVMAERLTVGGFLGYSGFQREDEERVEPAFGALGLQAAGEVRWLEGWGLMVLRKS